jgi:hypothetical protein
VHPAAAERRRKLRAAAAPAGRARKAQRVLGPAPRRRVALHPKREPLKLGQGILNIISQTKHFF